MTDRPRSEKTVAQDVLGVLFCLVGGFFAVSLLLYLFGQVPRAGMLAALAGLVVELAARLGAAGALSFSIGLASLGTVLFLRPKHLAAGRPFAALVAASLGVAFLLGAFGAGGALGAWLPGLLAGAVGRVLGAVLGAALGWLAWTLLSAARPARRDHADVLQRVGLATRSDAAGVSAAEAALLVTETRPVAPRPPPRPAPAPHAAERAPVRDQTIRPYVPPHAAPAPAPRAARAEAPSSAPPPARVASSQASPLAPAPARPLAPDSKEVGPLGSSTVTPPVPSWEVVPAEGEQREGVRADLGAETAGDAALPAWPPPADPVAEEVAEEEDVDGAEEAEDDLDEEGSGEVSREERQEALALLAAEFDAEELPALEEETEEEAEEATAAPADDSNPPRAAWEQIGLFDEEEIEEEAPAVAQVELTPTFDFESAEPKKPLHEPEPDVPARRVPEIEERPAARATPPAREAVPETTRDVLVPAPAVRAEPVVTTDEESGRWSRLVFEAGCAILEQKRVAVSMLERRFGVDFDQACRVLDELQEAGLIGPYMGGRSRDILLTREEWLAHAPQAS